MIKEVRPGTHEYERVIELGNANSVTLGFLPYEAIEQAAVDGRVLAFVDDGEVKGYALFGKRVRTGDISLTHLCVDRDQRGQGIAGLAIANGGGVERLVAQTGEALALGAMHPKQTSVAVTALRCAPGPLAYSAARQMVHHLRAIVGQSGPVSVVVDDQTRPPVDQALRDEGFRPEGSAWNAIVRTGVLGPRDPLPQELEHVGWERLNAHLVRDYERYAWPSKVFSGQVASYMVPIKHEYARVILGYDEPQGRLIELNPRAAASRDNAYYRSPRTLEAPARIIWWVSGGGPVGGMRAMSWLDEVETGHPSRLYRKYRHYGVLDESQVRAAASQMGGGSPKATVMLFSQTEVFSEPVPISRARQLCDSMSRTGFFQTTQAIDEHAVRRFYEEGMSQNAR